MSIGAASAMPQQPPPERRVTNDCDEKTKSQSAKTQFSTLPDVRA